MKKHRLLTISLLLGVVVLAAGCYTPGEGRQGPLPALSGRLEAEDLVGQMGIIWSQQDVGLWVNGEGTVTAVPDVAVLSMGVETQQKSLTNAHREAAEAMDKVMKALKKKGVAEKDIQTQRYNIYPVRRWIEKGNKEELIGYRVTNMVVAKVRKIDAIGNVIDAVAEAGGDATRIQGISFIVDDPMPYYKDAREKAIEDAMAKAKQIAAVADIDLGKPVYISEGAVYTPPVIREFYKGEAAVPAPAPPTAISPGELEFRISIQMVYNIN
jgi:uncharacterized protein YggE